MRGSGNIHGFTLVEMLAVLAVSAVLVSVAVPSFGALASSTRVSSTSNEVLAGLLLARSEAMKRRLRVVMCKSADGATCAAGGQWQQGWIVFTDTDADGQRDAGEALLHIQAALPPRMRVSGTAPVARYVSYTPSGATKTVGGGFQAGTLTVCSASAGPASGRQIVVSASGRPRTQTVKLAACA
jgi:type IV fimbrial biogenesis protein FimT